MQGEFAGYHVISERGVFFIYPVYAFCCCERLLLSVIDEYLLLKYAAHRLHRLLLVDPVVYVSFGNESLACLRRDHEIGFDTSHR